MFPANSGVPCTVPAEKHPQRLRRHAVNTPVRVAVVVTDRDGEAPVVGPYQVYQLSILALQLQCLALASIRRVVAWLFCNTKDYITVARVTVGWDGAQACIAVTR